MSYELSESDTKSSSTTPNNYETQEAPQPIHRVPIGKNGIPLNVVHEDESAMCKKESIEKTNTTADTESMKKYFAPQIKEDLSITSTEEEEEEGPNNCQDKDVVGRTKRFATIMNLLNSMLGAGILSISNTFVNTGIIFSVIQLIVMAILALLATDILIILASETNTKGLGELTEEILGRLGSSILSILNLLFINTALVAYLVLAGDMVTSWFELAGIDLKPLLLHAVMIMIYGVCLPIALTIPRKSIEFLRYFSTATVFCIVFFCAVMIYKSIGYPIEPTAVLSKVDISLFSTLSIYALSFSLPSVVVTTIRPYNRNLKKRKIVAGVAIGACFFFVIIPGICGYVRFGKYADVNILKNFDANDILVIVCRAGFFVVVSCAYPMVAQSCMAMWSTLVFKDDSPSALVFWRRAVILILTNVIPLLIAMFLPSAKPALAIGGALGGCLVDFVFPSVLYVVRHNGDYPLYHWKMVGLIVFAIFGIVAAVIATYQAIVDAIQVFSNI